MQQIKETVQKFAYGISLEWLDEGQIALVTTEGDMSPAGINMWANVLINTLDEWSDTRPIAILQDLTHPRQGLTPYARQRTRDILQHVPANHPTYNALILPPTFMNRIVEMFIRTLPFRAGLHIRVFTSKDTALAWLHESLQPATNDYESNVSRSSL